MFRHLGTPNWPFAFKFAIPTFLAILVVGFVDYISLHALNTVKLTLHDIVERKYDASVLIERNVDRLRLVNGELYLLQVKKEAGIAQDVDEETKALNKELTQATTDLTRFKNDYADPKDVGQIDAVLENIRRYSKAVKFVGSMLDIDFNATVAFIMPLRQDYNGMIESLSAISNAYLESSHRDAVQSDEMVKRRTLIVVIFNIGALIFTLALMMPLTYTTVRSIKSLAAATVSLADGNTQIDFVSLAREDELGQLVRALTIFRDNIERVRELRKISLLYASMNAMMDSLQQGLFTFGADGLCADSYSRACLALFKDAPAGRSVADVLRLSEKQRSNLMQILSIVFGSNQTMLASPEMILEMLPKYYTDAKQPAESTDDYPVALSYKPIMDSAGVTQSVLVIATDRSEELEAMRLTRERQKSILGVQRIVTDRNLFIQFFISVEKFFQEPEKIIDPAQHDQIKRDVHTFKGAAGIYYLYPLEAALHELESTLAALTGDEADSDTVILEAVAVINERLIETKGDVTKILGEAFDQQGSVRTLPFATLRNFVSTISSERSVEDIRKDFIRNLMAESMHKLLALMHLEIRELCDRYGKKVELAPIEGEDFFILSEPYAPLLANLTHISRNIISHAVDAPELRMKYNKPEICTVTIKTETFTRAGADWFRLTFGDDGGGIDAERLRKIIMERNPAATSLAAASHYEIIQHIFDDNVSTASGVTKLGGRGVGTAALKQAVEEGGGAIRVESEHHYFTRTIIEMPFTWQI